MGSKAGSISRATPIECHGGDRGAAPAAAKCDVHPVSRSRWRQPNAARDELRRGYDLRAWTDCPRIRPHLAPHAGHSQCRVGAVCGRVWRDADRDSAGNPDVAPPMRGLPLRESRGLDAPGGVLLVDGAVQSGVEPVMVRAGALTEVITLERHDTASDSWLPLELVPTVWAEATAQGDQQFEFRIRYRDDLVDLQATQPAMRIIYRGRTLELINVIEAERRTL